MSEIKLKYLTQVDQVNVDVAEIIAALGATVAAAYHLADNTCEEPDETGVLQMTVDAFDFEQLSNALESLETLPQLEDNVIRGPSSLGADHLTCLLAERAQEFKDLHAAATLMRNTFATLNNFYDALYDKANPPEGVAALWRAGCRAHGELSKVLGV